jgi:lysophospholipase L1-like esterase
LFTETKIMPQEINIDERLADRKLRTIYRFTNQDLDRETLPHFYDISDAVGARTRPCYLDMVHMTEEGYATVAKRIYEVFLKEFPAKETGPSGL